MGIRPETLFNQAIERIKANDVQGGVRLFLKMNTLVIPRSNELGFYERAGEYLFSNDHQHDGALLWETAYRNGHKSKIMQLVLGQYYLKTGKLAEAESVLTRFSQDYPDNPRGHHELGVVYLMRALINVNNSEVFVKNKLLAQTQMLIALKCKNDANFYERMMHGFTSPQGEIQVNLRVIEMLDSKINYGEHPYEYLEFEKGISVLLNAMIKILERSKQIEIESFTKRGKSSRFGLGIGYSGSVGFKPVITYSITKTGYGIGWNSGDFMPAKSLYQFKSANSTSSHFTLTPAASETLTNLYQLADIIKAERMHELNRPNKPATQEEMAANYEQLEASRRNGPSY
jgi:hypothetical protein